MKKLGYILLSLLLMSFAGRLTIEENLSVSGAGSTENLTDVAVTGTFVTVQVVYSGLNAADGTISFEQSISGKEKWDVVASSSGTLDNTKTSHTFNFTGLNTDRLRPVFTKASNTTGTIETIHYKFSN